jgi:hypothetical protein
MYAYKKNITLNINNCNSISKALNNLNECNIQMMFDTFNYSSNKYRCTLIDV